MTIIETKISALTARIMGMTEVSLEHLEAAHKAFKSRDHSEAQKIEETEDRYLTEFQKLEEDIFKLIALHQPVASDLKSVMQFFRIGQDIERIHLLIYRLAKKTRKLDEAPPIEIANLFESQFHLVISMLQTVINYFKKTGKNDFDEEIKSQQTECHNLKKVIRAIFETNLSQFVEHPQALMLFHGIATQLDKISKTILDLWLEVEVIPGSILKL